MANNPQMEHEANIFAMELLMPFDFVVKDIQGLDLTDDQEIDKMANRYRVPRGVIAMRIADVRAALAATATEGRL
jgi:Zn-dependent peptidase ImmA (M78 family)